MDGVIAHVDMNAYFATVLQQENPALRGKPIGVLKSQGRTCIIAASKEAKKLGIKTGCGLATAKKLAPNLITVPAAFDIYLDFTRRLKQIFTNLTPQYNIFSLDEAFLDITHCRNLYPDPIKFGELVQQQVKQELGEWVTCNVGISYTRLLAKLAGETSPKGSVTLITRENKDAHLAQAQFADVCGVGPRLERKLRGLGITNPYQINFWREEDLAPYVSEYWAKQLLKIAKGEDSPTLSLSDKPTVPMKTVGRTTTGYKLCHDETVIRSVLHNLTVEVAHKIRQMNMAGRWIGVFLEGEGQFWFDHKTLPFYVRHTQEIFDWVYHQLYLNSQRNFPVIRFGVTLGKLQTMDKVPISLLPVWKKNERLSLATDAVNDRFGLFTVKPATLLGHHIIRPEVTGYLGDRQFYGI